MFNTAKTIEVVNKNVIAFATRDGMIRLYGEGEHRDSHVTMHPNVFISMLGMSQPGRQTTIALHKRGKDGVMLSSVIHFDVSAKELLMIHANSMLMSLYMQQQVA